MLPIELKNARTHNLKGIDLILRAGELVVITGPSGAGKSSLAIDTLYAEGQRRFVESFSPYARQFLERLERPPIDSLDPVAATVAVDRRAPVKSSRSTLATLADLEPYLAALFAKEAVPVCASCHKPAERMTATVAAATLLREHQGAKGLIAYEARAAGTEAFLELRETLAKDGYRRVFLRGALCDLDSVRPSDVAAAGGIIDVIVDRITFTAKDSRRLSQAVEQAWLRGEGRAAIRIDDEATSRPFTRGFSCPGCGTSFAPASPGLFSYNSPVGACSACKGFGRVIDVDWNKVIPDGRKTLADGVIKAWAGKSADWERTSLAAYCKKHAIPMDVPWDDLPATSREAVLTGDGAYGKAKYPGVRAWFKWLETRTYKMHVRVFLARYREYVACTSCAGSRLNSAARAYVACGLNLPQFHALSVDHAQRKLLALVATDPQGKRAQDELNARLGYLSSVGLGYLNLDRQARTLSGGEAQRASLTTALGSSLTSALFIIDEPTVGLHPSDIPPLISAMRRLANDGNAVAVIEHDPAVVAAADRVVELGPGAGNLGGHLLFDGTPAALYKDASLPTTRARKATSATWKLHDVSGAKSTGSLEFRGLRLHNVQVPTLAIPLGKVSAIVGPSGSGKSTLVTDLIAPLVGRALGDMTFAPTPAGAEVTSVKALRSVTLVDQSPLGRTARGNAATYTKAWNRLRERFAKEPEAVRAGLDSSHFSFNVASKGKKKAGRCEACSGEGYETVEMQFLADVRLECPTCRGKRFRPEILAIMHEGFSVADVLAMTVNEVLAAFDKPDNHDYVLGRALSPVVEVGLGYLPLGQPLSTLSGGEAQRLKLARALSEDAKGALFVIDEPSAGLHGLDTAHVIKALHTLAERGATVLVVEHDLAVIAAVAHVIELGPGAGDEGGRVVATGTPAELAETQTKTGRALASARAGGSAAKVPTRAAPKPVLPNAITVVNAQQHTLKGVSCTIPHGKITVVTGPSGSGKSSLAFDVVFAEGQRRFMETLTPYARQFLPTLPRPEVDSVLGMPPAIALEQRTTRSGPNSTVATVTEIAHYMRLLYAKVGDVHCPRCDTLVAARNPHEIFDELHAKTGTFTLYASAVHARKGTYLDVFSHARTRGIATARVDGAIVKTDPPPRLLKSKEHSIDLIVFYGKLKELTREQFDLAIDLGRGTLRWHEGAPHAEDIHDSVLSTSRACMNCGQGVPELDPRFFSFNTKQGQCEACEGCGIEGGPTEVANSSRVVCTKCEGSRLAPLPRGVRLSGLRYHELTALSVTRARAMIASWKLNGTAKLIGATAQAELLRRLSFVQEIGLGYLALGRPAQTLSGGEMQRLRLSAQLGSGLTGALYVLDEPTIGLHPRDTTRLIRNLRGLTEKGSTVLVVEHDTETIQAADHVLDMGPGGGHLGGHLVASGDASAVFAGDGPTARALRDPERYDRRVKNTPNDFIELLGAKGHNLKDVTFRVPKQRLTVVAGVSGSGKSTLVGKVFFPALRKKLGLVSQDALAHKALRNETGIKRAVAVDQSPIGRSPRSTPATFLGIWDEIRKLFAASTESKVRGYTIARFSFNTGQGRCSACEGQGAIVSEMSFLPEVVTPCGTCRGLRFEPATLDVLYLGYSAGEVLGLSAKEAAELFRAHPKISRPLQTLDDLGVGYIKLGQGSHTLSGGEAQRLKLAAELTAKSAHEATCYVLDEPTTGLHISDVKKLLGVLHTLVERGDTLVVIEHHPDVIQSADWVVELGPEAGEEGGTLVFEGTPEDLLKSRTATALALRPQKSTKAKPKGAEKVANA